MAENLQVNNFFQKQTVFVFTESWSSDQLMQKPIKEDRIKNTWQLKLSVTALGRKGESDKWSQAS